MKKFLVSLFSIGLVVSSAGIIMKKANEYTPAQSNRQEVTNEIPEYVVVKDGKIDLDLIPKDEKVTLRYNDSNNISLSAYEYAEFMNSTSDGLDVDIEDDISIQYDIDIPSHIEKETLNEEWLDLYASVGGNTPVDREREERIVQFIDKAIGFFGPAMHHSLAPALKQLGLLFVLFSAGDSALNILATLDAYNSGNKSNHISFNISWNNVGFRYGSYAGMILNMYFIAKPLLLEILSVISNFVPALGQIVGVILYITAQVERLLGNYMMPGNHSDIRNRYSDRYRSVKCGGNSGLEIKWSWFSTIIIRYTNAAYC